jgi:hypothetical protein
MEDFVLRKAITVVAVSGAALFGLTTPALADPSTEPKVIGVSSSVHVTGEDTAYIHGVYRCYSGTEAHLWVSAKQGDKSGALADAWWDTNYAFSETDPDGITATCDGQVHNVKVPIQPTPFMPTGDLQNNVDTWIQFCLVEGEDEASAIVASKSFWGTTVGA